MCHTSPHNAVSLNGHAEAHEDTCGDRNHGVAKQRESKGRAPKPHALGWLIEAGSLSTMFCQTIQDG
jgi:hypothetical protein